MANSTLIPLLSNSTVLLPPAMLSLPTGADAFDSEGTRWTKIGNYQNRAVFASQSSFDDGPCRTTSVFDDGRYFPDDTDPYLKAMPSYVVVLDLLNRNENVLLVDLIVSNAKANVSKIDTIKMIRTLTNATLTDSKNAYEAINGGANPHRGGLFYPAINRSN